MNLIVKQVEVPQPPPPPVTEDRFVLEMTREEAVFLISVFGKISGEGRMKAFTSNVYHALYDQGLRSDLRNPTGMMTAR